MAGKAGYSLWKNSSRLVFRALIAFAVVLLLSGVGMVVWGCRMYYQYQRYLDALEYNFGDTAVITASTDDGACQLAPLNRYALYTFLSDSTGKRVGHADDPLTGRTISFDGESAVSRISGTISETEQGVRVMIESEGNEWSYYFYNRSAYDDYLRACSPEGWTVPNLSLDSGA